eukprot:6521110-Prymnesium_polylepis.1
MATTGPTVGTNRCVIPRGKTPPSQRGSRSTWAQRSRYKASPPTIGSIAVKTGWARTSCLCTTPLVNVTPPLAALKAQLTTPWSTAVALVVSCPSSSLQPTHTSTSKS